MNKNKMFATFDGKNEQELRESIINLNNEYKGYKEQEKKLNKVALKGAVWFYLIPFIGPFLYRYVRNKRLNIEEVKDAIFIVKEKMVYIEFQLIYIERLLEEKFDSNSDDIKMKDFK